MASLVELTGVSYHYPEATVAALDSVDLALDGGLCVVAGPSGGGKSTLLRLFNGLVPHMYGGRISGRAFVAGRDVLRTPTRHLATSVGFLFQDAERQAVHATVERDVAFGLENLGVSPTEMRGRVNDILERLGIAHLRDRTIATLSGGERQRVAVAGALVLRPRLLVLDEPFSQLDGAAARALLDLCLELREKGTALVVSEHRLDELLPVADSMLGIAGGRVTGPSSPSLLAATLDSAPQVVRLSQRMGWSPPVLDAAVLRVPPPNGRDAHQARMQPHRSEPAWRLDRVAAGHWDLLQGVTAEGRCGEVVAVMGDNGSGKTTMLRVIAGLVTPRSGSAWRSAGRIAYLPQNPAALLHRETVGAEIAWTLRGQAPADRDDAATAALLQALGVAAVTGRDPRDLSSGQRQRAAIAAILCGSPSLVLLDEPTRGMDGAARDGLVAAVRALATRGASVVVATHDSELAAAVSDRVLIIARSSVRDGGAPTTALSGDHAFATQLGRLFPSPGPVTVDAVADVLEHAHTGVGARA
jgi:energy-coupling factor transport system ATP-binding protein